MSEGSSLGVFLNLIAIGYLFYSTIRQNKKNRGIVLGVVTVAAFMVFLLYSDLEAKHSTPWLLNIIEALIILTGLSVLAFVVLDIIRWASRKRERVADGSQPQGGAGTK